MATSSDRAARARCPSAAGCRWRRSTTSTSVESAHRSWPAPSATTITACSRSASRRSRLARNPRGPSSRNGTSGISTKFDVRRGERRVAGDEPGMAAHELDEADAVARAGGLDVGAADDLDGGRERRLETEAAVDEVDVVVDRLGDADDARSAARAARPPRRSRGAAHACRRRRSTNRMSIPSAVQRVDHLGGVLLAARRAEHRAALVVDVARTDSGVERDRRVAVRAAFSPS